MKYYELKEKIKNLDIKIYHCNFTMVDVNDEEYYIKSIKINNKSVILILSEKFPIYHIPVSIFMNLEGLDNKDLKIKFESDNKQLEILSLNIYDRTNVLFNDKIIIIDIEV